MAIHKAPENGSTPAGAQVGEHARRDLLSLSLTPVRQGLTFYAEINRSILDTFSRFIPWGMGPFGALSERNRLPATAAESRSPRRPAQPPAVERSSATKRSATKPAATKRPATNKRPTPKADETKRPDTTKRPAAQPSATKRAATTKRPAAHEAVATKRPAATKGAAKTRSAAPLTPRRTASQGAAQKRVGQAAPKPPVKGAGRVKPSAAKKVASSRPRDARASAGKKA